MIYLDIRTAKYKVKRTLMVLESMKDGNHVGDLDDMVTDLRVALNSLDG